MSFTLAIIGRPNVGKSTLFNRLIGKKLSIVDDTPGVTRDWRSAPAHLMGLDFIALDTAGLEEAFDETMEGRMRQQTEAALAEADMAMLMVDARAGVTPLDEHFARWLRKQKIPSFLVANKCEGKAGMEGLYDLYQLGMGEPIPVSAEHGEGMSDLFDVLRGPIEKKTEEEQALLDAQAIDEEEEGEGVDFEEGSEVGFGDLEPVEEDIEKPIKLAIIGRPNVGKSTLLNALLGYQRVMTGPEPGVTRDSIAVDWEWKGRKFKLVDTAGMRKKSKVIDKIERMSVDESLRAVRLAQVVILMLDANMVLDKQDLIIARRVIDEGRALVIGVNKWDAVENRNETLEKIELKLETSLAQLRGIPTVTISALKNRRLDKLLDKVLDVYEVWNSRVPTGQLNRWLDAMESSHPAPLVSGRHNKLRYMTQIKNRPPTFALWCSRPKELPDSYVRYLINGLRERFNIPAVPIRIYLRTTKNPYVK